MERRVQARRQISPRPEPAGAVDYRGTGGRPNEALQQSSDLVIANVAQALLFGSLAA